MACTPAPTCPPTWSPSASGSGSTTAISSPPRLRPPSSAPHTPPSWWTARWRAMIGEAGDDPGVPVGALGSFQRRNFAVAMAAAEAYLGELDDRAVAAAGAEIRVPGRLQVVGDEPLTLLDGAHNPEGMDALVES